MILILDTSKPEAMIKLMKSVDDRQTASYSWVAHRSLARELLTKLIDRLQEQDSDLSKISGIVYFKGPGSFTGLRIGASVVNTIAHTNSSAIVGETGDDWIEKGLARLKSGENDRIVIPEYGRDANITKPRK